MKPFNRRKGELSVQDGCILWGIVWFQNKEDPKYYNSMRDTLELQG